MSGDKYVFDQLTFTIRKAGVNVGRIVWKVVSVLLSAMSLIVVGYAFFALFVSTDTERRLKRENRMYDKMYPMLQPKEELLADAVAGLQHRDASLYEQVFHTTVPDPEGFSGMTLGADTIPDSKMVGYTAAKSEMLVSVADSVEATFARIFSVIADSSFVAPPLDIPVADISYPQIGASCGWKLNPFFKTYVRHEGLDIIAPQGTPVLAAASGTVVLVSRSVKGSGNRVVIAHKGGYRTVYCHLLDISVTNGSRVSRGQRIGTVGMTGQSYSPHLHYEVQLRGNNVNPVNHIFASVSPEEYHKMLYMAANTEQSMD